MKGYIDYTLFFTTIVFLNGHPQYAYDLFNLSLTLCLQHAQNNGIYCHSYDLIRISQGPTCIHHSTNSKTAIQWCSLNQNRALKLHANVKVHIGQDIQEQIKQNLLKTAFKSRPYHFNFFKDCLPQILFGPFLNTLTHINYRLLFCKHNGTFQYQ